MTPPLPMTRARRIALALGAPLALIIIAWTALTEVAYAGIGSYPVRLIVPVYGSTAGLSLGAADTQVTQAAGSQLRLTGTAHYSLVRSTVTWHSTASGVIVTPECHFVTGVCSFDLRAVVPAGKRVNLSAGSGNIVLSGLTGPVTAGSGSGNITGSALSGPQVTLAAGAGNIAIDGLTSLHVVASAGSGDISLTFSRVPSRVRVSASSGNVSLVLPPGPTFYRVHAATDSGNRTIGVLTDSASTHVITVTDGSGDISITN
jgi:hypothetical protein